MDPQVAADLPAGVRQSLPLQEGRRVNGARGEDHVVGAHLEPGVALHGARLGIDDRAPHPDSATVLDHYAVDATAADDPRARLHGQRQISDVHAELGVEWAAERADTGAVATSSVAPDRASAVTKLAAPLLHGLAVGAHDVRGHRPDVERLLDGVEKRIQLRAVHAP